MIRTVLTIIFCSLFVWPSTAATVEKSYGYFLISGKTLEELERELSRRGPQVKSTGQRHPGVTRMQFNTQIAYAERNGRCRIASAKVHLKAKIILPHWRNRSQADAETRLIWDALSLDIRRHENQHVRIAEFHAGRLERRLTLLGWQPDCDTAALKARNASETILAEQEAAQAKFEASETRNFESRLLRSIRQRARMIANGEIRG